jgi:hypothetical protein
MRTRYRTFSAEQEENYSAAFKNIDVGCWGKAGLAAAMKRDPIYPLTDNETAAMWCVVYFLIGGGGVDCGVDGGVDGGGVGCSWK